MKEIVKSEMTSEMVRVTRREDIKTTMRTVEEQSGEQQTVMGYIVTK
jgi:hypothetical protein